MKEGKLSGSKTAMVFLKHFDATTQSLFGIGKVDMARSSTVNDLTPVINERMKWAPGTSLTVYEVANSGLSPTARADSASFLRRSNLA